MSTADARKQWEEKQDEQDRLFKLMPKHHVCPSCKSPMIQIVVTSTGGFSVKEICSKRYTTGCP